MAGNGNGNGRATVKMVYETLTPLEARVRRLEYGMVALLVLSGGQTAASVRGSSLPAFFTALFNGIF